MSAITRAGRRLTMHGLGMGLAAALAVAGCAASAGTSTEASQAQRPASTASAPAVGAPAVAPGVPTGGVASGGSAAGGTAIAYPYPVYPGSPGLAPDHTIIVTGFGQAAEAADGSDRAAAQQTALRAALADAKAQADTVAKATGVTIQGVLSVSASSAQGSCCPMPLAGGGAQTGPASSAVIAPAPVPPSASELAVTVTVAYRIG